MEKKTGILRSETGASLLEYAITAAVVVTLCLASISAVGRQSSKQVQHAGDTLGPSRPAGRSMTNPNVPITPVQNNPGGTYNNTTPSGGVGTFQVQP